jgi:hypothetical protein
MGSQKQKPTPEGRTRFELYCVCRHCLTGTVFNLVMRQQQSQDIGRQFGLQTLLQQGPMAVTDSLNNYMSVEGYVSIKDVATIRPPEYVPPDVVAAFNEGATSLAVRCFNAAGTMFRLAVGLATRPLLPPDGDTSISAKQRRDLGLRLAWLFDKGRLPSELRELSKAIREDGNDGAHQGTLTKTDAEDILDFSVRLFERMFTEPEKLRLAQERRTARRQP